MKNIVILASGSGSNYQFIAETISSLNLPINILGVLTNKSNAGICGKVNSKLANDNAAYLQVKDLSINQDEKVFIFNGWTFASDPSLAPFDHAIYDLQLLNCQNV